MFLKWNLWLQAYCKRGCQQIESSIHPLPHIISNNQIIFQTLPGRLQPCQALLEHTVTQAYSSSFHFSNAVDHCKLNEYSKPLNGKSTPCIQFKMWLCRRHALKLKSGALQNDIPFHPHIQKIGTLHLEKTNIIFVYHTDRGYAYTGFCFINCGAKENLNVWPINTSKSVLYVHILHLKLLIVILLLCWLPILPNFNTKS